MCANILYKVIICKTQRERNGRSVLYFIFAGHFENKYNTGHNIIIVLIINNRQTAPGEFEVYLFIFLL